MAKPVPFVIMTPRWSGENTLVRLLAGGGTVRCSGFVLGRPVRRPAALLRQVLGRATAGETAHGALVHPDDLWLANAIDPVGFVTDLGADGIRIIVLVRRSHEDRGLSRAVCGLEGEVLPARARSVDADEVILFAEHSGQSAAWLADVAAHAPTVVFEDDLLTVPARQATVHRLAGHLGISEWSVVPELEAPTHDALWGLVREPEQLARSLRTLTPAGDVTDA